MNVAVRAVPTLSLWSVMTLAPIGCTSDTGSTSDTSDSAAEGGDTGTADLEPPTNPTLADGVWPASHNGSYAQGSSSLLYVRYRYVLASVRSGAMPADVSECLLRCFLLHHSPHCP